jgi:hypothetical protein
MRVGVLGPAQVAGQKPERHDLAAGSHAEGIIALGVDGTPVVIGIS